MNSQRIIYIATLIRKSISGELTSKELNELDAWLDESPRHQELFDKYKSPDFLSSVDFEKDLMESQQAYSEFMYRLNPKTTVRRITRNRYLVAAVFIAFVCISSILLYVLSYKGVPTITSDNLALLQQQADSMAADSTNIVLITADGKKIPMRDPKAMLTVSSGTITVGEQSIDASSQSTVPSSEVVYNTLKILRGKRFKMQLSDGTLVWLNADSEIKFPNRFDKKERTVSVKGELFFDVAKDKEHPFIVETPNGKISVLGTAFNVYCYQDEVPVTTLVRGKIAYSLGKESVILNSGQQCRVENNKLSVKNVDTYEYVSWIDEVIVFKDKTLNEIMNTLSRLYDVNIQYEDQSLKRLPFTGSFKQYEHLDDIIRMIEECGLIHIRQENNKLIISK